MLTLAFYRSKILAMLFQGHEQEVELQRASHSKEIAKIQQQLVRIYVREKTKTSTPMLYETFRILQRTRLFDWS